MSEGIKKLKARYGSLFRAAEFGIAGAVGFLVAELILTIGVYLVYGTFIVPSNAFSSPALIGLNIIAFGIGVCVSFFINEKITVSNEGEQRLRSVKKVVKRLLKFQGVYVVGNAITIGVQLALLRFFTLAPSIGNIIGAIIAFPVSYFFSMHFVWSIRATGRPSKPVNEQGKLPGVVEEKNPAKLLENSIDNFGKEMRLVFKQRHIVLEEYRLNATSFETGITIDFALKIHISDKMPFDGDDLFPFDRKGKQS